MFHFTFKYKLYHDDPGEAATVGRRISQPHKHPAMETDGAHSSCFLISYFTASGVIGTV